MSKRIIAEIECADGSVATIATEGRIVIVEFPGGDVPVSLRGGPANARRIAEAMLLAARIADAGAPA